MIFVVSNDLAAEHPDLTAKFRDRLFEWNAAMPKDAGERIGLSEKKPLSGNRP